jgi:hypothetical protein
MMDTVFRVVAASAIWWQEGAALAVILTIAASAVMVMV